MKLPTELKTEEDLSNVFAYFCLACNSNSSIKHLRFGQFIYNLYSVEWENSYNEKNPLIAYSLILDLILNLQSYFVIKSALEKDQKVLPQELNNV